MKKKEFRWTLIFALLVGLVFFLRNILLIYGDWKNPNLVFTPFSGGDEDIYAAQIREVFEGKLFSGDAYSFETRNRLPIFNWLTPLILGLFAKVLNSVDLVLLIGDFLFPLLSFVLIVAFVYTVTRQYWASVVTGLSSLFLFQLINKIPPITKTLAIKFWDLLTLKEPIFLFFNRLPTQFTFIVFFLFIISLYALLNSKSKNKLSCFLPGILSGLLAYLYFYQWTASIMTLVMAWLISLGFKNKRLIRQLLANLGVAVLISSGYLYQIFSVDLTDKQLLEGRIDGRFIEPLTTLRYLLLTGIIFWLIRQRALKQVLAAVFMAAVALLNLQLVTGFTMDPGHWPNSTFEPMLVIAAGFLGIEILTRIKKQNWLKYSWILILPIFGYAIANQVALTNHWPEYYYYSPAEHELYRWLNQHTPADSVTLSFNRLINRRLPAITHQYPYLPYGSYCQIGIDQIWERFNLANSFIALKPEFTLQLLERSSKLPGYLFEQAYRYHWLKDLSGLEFPEAVRETISQTHPVFTSGYLYIPDNIRSRNLEQIAQLARVPLKDRLCRYRLDYLILTETEKQEMEQPLDTTIFLPVSQEGEFSLYQVKPGLCSSEL